MSRFETKFPLKVNAFVSSEQDVEVKYKMRKQAARKLGNSNGNA